MPFEGFQASKEKLTPIPETFFSEVLSVVDQLGELKIILYAFWFLYQQERDRQYLTGEDFLADRILMKALQPNAEDALRDGLEQAVQHNILIKAVMKNQDLYFLNTPRGRAAVQAIRHGDWDPETGSRQVTALHLERPNIFRIYEENIGPLTPIIAEILQDAEATYPAHWIEDAIQIAVEKNVRNWRYIDAILKSWQKEGRSEKDRRDSKEDRRKYIEGEYGDIIEH